MPAQVELFDKVLNFPSKTYIDTNYLLYLKSYLIDPRHPMYQSCKNFYDKMVANNVVMYTSILSLQEAIYIILYKSGIYEDMKNFQKPSDFRKQLPQEFIESYKKHFPNVVDFMQFFYNLNIKLAFPKSHVIPPMADKSIRVAGYAVGLLKRYYELDPMDAFHVAIAKCLGIDHIVSTDKGLKVINEIKLFCYN